MFVMTGLAAAGGLVTAQRRAQAAADLAALAGASDLDDAVSRRRGGCRQRRRRWSPVGATVRRHRRGVGRRPAGALARRRVTAEARPGRLERALRACDDSEYHDRIIPRLEPPGGTLIHRRPMVDRRLQVAAPADGVVRREIVAVGDGVAVRAALGLDRSSFGLSSVAPCAPRRARVRFVPHLRIEKPQKDRGTRGDPDEERLQGPGGRRSRGLRHPAGLAEQPGDDDERRRGG